MLVLFLLLSIWIDAVLCDGFSGEGCILRAEMPAKALCPTQIRVAVGGRTKERRCTSQPACCNHSRVQNCARTPMYTPIRGMWLDI